MWNHRVLIGENIMWNHRVLIGENIMWDKLPFKNVLLTISATFFLLATWPYPWYAVLCGGIVIYIYIYIYMARKIFKQHLP